MLVHVGLVHCYWMTAIEANRLVGLTRNLVVTGPWPGLMTSGPDQSVESAHCHRIWSCWLLTSRKVRCTYLFLSVAGTGLRLSSAVMAMKSCSLVWADRISRMPQRCSGMSSCGSPAALRKLSSVSRMCWSLMATWMCWFFCTHCTSS